MPSAKREIVLVFQTRELSSELRKEKASMILVAAKVGEESGRAKGITVLWKKVGVRLVY